MPIVLDYARLNPGASFMMFTLDVLEMSRQQLVLLSTASPEMATWFATRRDEFFGQAKQWICVYQHLKWDDLYQLRDLVDSSNMHTINKWIEMMHLVGIDYHVSIKTTPVGDLLFLQVLDDTGKIVRPMVEITRRIVEQAKTWVTSAHVLDSRDFGFLHDERLDNTLSEMDITWEDGSPELESAVVLVLNSTGLWRITEDGPWFGWSDVSAAAQGLGCRVMEFDTGKKYIMYPSVENARKNPLLATLVADGRIKYHGPVP